jgi:hypothetical protein
MNRPGESGGSGCCPVGILTVIGGLKLGGWNEEHRRAMLVSGYGRLDLLPSGTVERRIADRFQVGPEAFLVLSQCLIPRLSPGIVAGEIRPDEQGAIQLRQFWHGPSMCASIQRLTARAADTMARWASMESRLWWQMGLACRSGFGVRKLFS